MRLIAMPSQEHTVRSAAHTRDLAVLVAVADAWRLTLLAFVDDVVAAAGIDRRVT